MSNADRIELREGVHIDFHIQSPDQPAPSISHKLTECLVPQRVFFNALDFDIQDTDKSEPGQCRNGLQGSCDTCSKPPRQYTKAISVLEEAGYSEEILNKPDELQKAIDNEPDEKKRSKLYTAAMTFLMLDDFYYSVTREVAPPKNAPDNTGAL